MIYDQIIQVENVSGKPIPATPNEPPPTWNSEEFSFEVNETRIVPENVGRHLVSQNSKKLKVRGKPVSMKDILTDAVRDPDNLKQIFKAKGKITITSVGSPKGEPIGQSIEDLARDTHRPDGGSDPTGGRVPIHRVD